MKSRNSRTNGNGSGRETRLVRRTPPPAASRRLQDAAPAADPGSKLGIGQWFRLNDRDAVERVLETLHQLGIQRLRTGLSWADFLRPAGKAWYDWLIPRLAEDVDVLPCFMHTPPESAVAARTSLSPKHAQQFVDFLERVLGEYGRCFEIVDLWNEPTHPDSWNRKLDPEWTAFCQMINRAADCARQHGKQTVLGGAGPANLDWFRSLGEQGTLERIDVAGVSIAPGSSDADPSDWTGQLTELGRELERWGGPRRMWINQAGYSTWQQDEHRQLMEFRRLIDAPVERVYWYSAEDVAPDEPSRNGSEADERDGHFGLRRADGSPKLLFRVLTSGGLPTVRAFAGIDNGRQPPSFDGNGRHRRRTGTQPYKANGKRRTAPVLITGGAGFVGTNLAVRLLESGRDVLIYDNLSRPGVEQNLRWLLEQYGGRVQVDMNDVRDARALRHAVGQAGAVFHLAAQVAVTTSLVDPRTDFAINAGGTLNVLEACRQQESPPPLLFTSTNKVYGNLRGVALCREGVRYLPADADIRALGVGEDHPLDFHSPYGCSKGVADQYVIDYARCYRLPAVVFRMSCIYGPHQFGTEDQGWIAHFARRILENKPITLYGDGHQIRDVLYVTDLAEAMVLVIDHIDALAGRAFNMGGGPANAVSLLEVLDALGGLHSGSPQMEYGPWRQGDQKYYVSNTHAFQNATGWQPRVSATEGIARLYQWLAENRSATTECAVA